MRAMVCTGYGSPDVLQLRDVVKPVPKDNVVLVRIRATTVTTADCELRRFDFAPWIWLPMRLGSGIRRPRRPVLGHELAGDVDSAGKDVRSVRKGDRVFAATGIGLGAYAARMRAPREAVTRSSSTQAEAAASRRSRRHAPPSARPRGAGGACGRYAACLLPGAGGRTRPPAPV